MGNLSLFEPFHSDTSPIYNPHDFPPRGSTLTTTTKRRMGSKSKARLMTRKGSSRGSSSRRVMRMRSEGPTKFGKTLESIMFTGNVHVSTVIGIYS